MNETAQKTDRFAAARAAKAAKRAAPPAPEPMSIDHEDATVTRAAGRQAAARTPTREPTRSAMGRVVVEGHGGEQLTRTRTFVADPFDVPANMIPKNWTYQWNLVSVAGNSDIVSDYSLMMHQNGWRAVPAERYAGTLLPANAKGAIIRGGQRLEERPLALTEEARAEDIRNAKQLISDRNESLKLSQTKAQMPDGFEMGGKYRGTGGDIRLSIDRALDIPRPQHTLADD